MRAWCVGRRDDGLRAVIDALKFERTRAAHLPLAELLDEALPVIPSDVIVVPVPTLTYHKRVRGYGHIELVAKAFAKKRGLPYSEALIRHSRHVQRGASRTQRIAQAKETYASTTLQKGQTYLLVDDVYTTGATLEYASRALIAGGAGQVWVAALSRQPLEK
ncbi:MAG: phosphoribosyltransferase family protein [Candidatus Saccharimonas sp.]